MGGRALHRCGVLDPAVNVTDLHVAMLSMVLGYAVFRTRFASELGIAADDLDDRVATVLERLALGLASSHNDTPDIEGRRGS